MPPFVEKTPRKRNSYTRRPGKLAGQRTRRDAPPISPGKKGVDRVSKETGMEGREGTMAEKAPVGGGRRRGNRKTPPAPAGLDVAGGKPRRGPGAQPAYRAAGPSGDGGPCPPARGPSGRPGGGAAGNPRPDRRPAVEILTSVPGGHTVYRRILSWAWPLLMVSELNRKPEEAAQAVRVEAVSRETSPVTRRPSGVRQVCAAWGTPRPTAPLRRERALAAQQHRPPDRRSLRSRLQTAPAHRAPPISHFGRGKNPPP